MSIFSRRICAFLVSMFGIAATTTVNAADVEQILGFDVDGVTVTMTPDQIDDELIAQGYERLDTPIKVISSLQSETVYRDDQASSSSEISVRTWDGLVEQVEMTTSYQDGFDVARERTSLLDLLGEPAQGCTYLEKMARFGCTWTAGVAGSRVTLAVDLTRSGGTYAILRDVPR